MQMVHKTLGLAAVIAFTGSASAAILLQDDFSGTASATLAGTTPEVSAAGNSWISIGGASLTGLIFDGAGNITGNTSTARNSIDLGASAVGATDVVTVTVEITTKGTTNAWLAFGFDDDAAYGPISGTGTGDGSGGGPTARVFGNTTNPIGVWNGLVTSSANALGSTTWTDGTNSSFTLVFDRASGTLDAFKDNTQFINDAAFTDTGFRYFGFYGVANSDVKLNSVLISAVPEPASAVLAGVGGLLMLGRLRRS